MNRDAKKPLAAIIDGPDRHRRPVESHATMFLMDVKTAIETGDAAALRDLLAKDPSRAHARWKKPKL